MKIRLTSFALPSAILCLCISSAKAEWDYWGIKYDSNGHTVFTIDSITGEEEQHGETKDFSSYGYLNHGMWPDEESPQKFNVVSGDGSGWQFDIDSDTWTNSTADWRSDYWKLTPRALIRQTRNGEIHLGPNSLVTKEDNGIEKMWAQDANGNKIPIDITNGTKLLINGRDVEQSIDNVGALSAALTALPTVPTDSPIACGIGTGTHSGNYAFSGGCASKVNEKLSFNAAASFVPGQDYQGTDYSYSARAGFVFKFGEFNKPTQISLNESTELKKEVKDLKAKNADLLARLEKLENIAFTLQKNEELKLSKGF